MNRSGFTYRNATRVPFTKTQDFTDETGRGLLPRRLEMVTKKRGVQEGNYEDVKGTSWPSFS